jgi:hypothetical protein
MRQREEQQQLAGKQGCEFARQAAEGRSKRLMWLEGGTQAECSLDGPKSGNGMQTKAQSGHQLLRPKQSGALKNQQ